MTRSAIRVLVAALLCATLTGCAASAGTGSSGLPAGSTAAQIIHSSCTRCHPVDRIRAAKHDETAWTATVTRMRGKGAKLSDAEAQEVIAFLAGGGGAGL